MNPRICEECGKEYINAYPYSPAQWEKRKYCNKSCSGKAILHRNDIEEKAKLGVLREISKRSGSNHYLWNGGTTLDKTTGYINDNRSGKRQHRVVMEEILGRPLLSIEHVHHIDGNKSNNNPENLELLSHQEHMMKHRKYHIVDDMKQCSFCKNNLPISYFHHNKTTPTGLSQRCKRCVSEYASLKKYAHSRKIR